MSDFGLQGGGTNSVGFTLIDGQGTTANGSAVDLGGLITEDVYVTYTTANTGNPIGLFYLLGGIIENLTPPNEAIFFGELPDMLDMSTRNGYTVINSDNGANGCIIGNEKAVIEVVKQPEGYGSIELEVYSPDDTIVSALKITPDYLTFGDYFNASNLYLSLDGDLDLFQLGKIDGGTYIEVDNANSVIKLTNVPSYADDAAAAGGGLTTGHLYKTTTGGSTFLKIVP